MSFVKKGGVKKECHITDTLWVDGGARTHDIQNHNLTL